MLGAPHLVVVAKVADDGAQGVGGADRNALEYATHIQAHCQRVHHAEYRVPRRLHGDSGFQLI